MPQSPSPHDMRGLIGNTLRIGVSAACLVAFIGGFTAIGWIQTGVLILLLTPVLRVLLSLFDFLRERDWLYAFITAVVLAVIISNSLEGTISI